MVLVRLTHPIRLDVPVKGPQGPGQVLGRGLEQGPVGDARFGVRVLAPTLGHMRHEPSAHRLEPHKEVAPIELAFLGVTDGPAVELLTGPGVFDLVLLHSVEDSVTQLSSPPFSCS